MPALLEKGQTMFHCYSVLKDLLEKVCGKNFFLVKLHSAISIHIKNAPHRG